MGLILVKEEQAYRTGQKLSRDAEVMSDLAILCFSATVVLTHWVKWAQIFSLKLKSVAEWEPPEEVGISKLRQFINGLTAPRQLGQ